MCLCVCMYVYINRGIKIIRYLSDWIYFPSPELSLTGLGLGGSCGLVKSNQACRPLSVGKVFQLVSAFHIFFLYLYI